MAPSAAIVLMWRLSLHVLYPYAYTERYFEEEIGDEHLVWDKGRSAISDLVMLLVLRETVINFLLFALFIDAMQVLREDPVR